MRAFLPNKTKSSKMCLIDMVVAPPLLKEAQHSITCGFSKSPKRQSNQRYSFIDTEAIIPRKQTCKQSSAKPNKNMKRNIKFKTKMDSEEDHPRLTIQQSLSTEMNKPRVHLPPCKNTSLQQAISNISKDDLNQRYQKALERRRMSDSYHRYTKKTFKSSIVQEKLEPILKNTRERQESKFFSVQKMTLINSQKLKKFNSDMQSMQTQKTQQDNPEQRKKAFLNSMNFVKKKFNIHKVLAYKQDLYFKNEQCIGIYNNYKANNTVHQIQNSNKMKIQQQKLDSNKERCMPVQNVENYGKIVNIQTQSKPSKTDRKTMPLKRKSFSQNKRPTKIFKVPFPTYYYRDLIWKVNFTNQMSVQVPIQYQHRLKVFVGRGNNSCMVRGLIQRRPWYSFTEKIEQANFAWTQLKLLNYFKFQNSVQSQITATPEATFQKDSLLTSTDSSLYYKYMSSFFAAQEHSNQRLLTRSKAFKFNKVIKVSSIKQTRMHNHLLNNYVLGNKKALLATMSNYYHSRNQNVFDYLPLTFHIKEGLQDKKYFQFLKYYHRRNREISKNQKGIKQYNAWIVKPGQNSNRGCGIKMCLTLQDIKAVLKKKQLYHDGTQRTYIVQAYIQRPLLYFRRKIDLRHYMLITCINGHLKGYWYKQGYVRTSSSEYSLKENSSSIHLTNDAIQKYQPDYGKYQKGNKISYDELNLYISKYHKQKKIGFYDHIYPKMKKIATDAIRASSGAIDPTKLQNNFQVFGLDFMIDDRLDVWLIEVNTNPCLELSCPLLSYIIPKMVENTLELTLDAMFPPPVRYNPKGVHYFKELQKENKIESLWTGSLDILDNKLLQQQDDVFEDDGQQWKD